MRGPFSRPTGIAILIAVVALSIGLPGLGASGFWSEAELPVFDRTRAALGHALSGLERTPWFPDVVRTRSYALFGDAFGAQWALRLPHLLAATCLAAIAAGLARRRGSPASIACVAGLFVLAFPAVAVGARTVLGNPIGELTGVAAVVLGCVALGRRSAGLAAAWAVPAAIALALSIASGGLVLGGSIPLLALATADHAERSGRIAPILWLGAGASLVVAITLALQQGDGYIPLLGAATDLELVDKPEARRFATVLADFAFGVFPWAPLVAVGAITERGRWPAMWALCAIVVTGGWSLVYGPTPVPAAVPAALCAAAAIELLGDRQRPLFARRCAVFVIAGGILVLRKDAERTPAEVAVPVYRFDNPHHYPADRLEAADKLGELGGMALLAVLAAALVAPRPPRYAGMMSGTWLSPAARGRLVVGAFGLAAGLGAWTHARVLVPRTAALLSLRRPLERHAQWVQSGALPRALAIHRLRDPGFDVYGPDPADVQVLASRRDIIGHLNTTEPRVALIRDIDFPTVHQSHHEHGWPLFVLDTSSFHMMLVSNVLVPGAEDLNRIPEVLHREPPTLAHETLVRFEQYVEIIGWQIDAPIVRGGKHTVQIAIRVLRPLPGGSKIYARFLQGRLSRINAEPHELAEGLYPCSLWRAGDYILHRFEFEAPTLEILPGDHEFVVGLRRSEKNNYEITVPEGKTGEHGVVIRDKKRNFATLGEVPVW